MPAGERARCHRARPTRETPSSVVTFTARSISDMIVVEVLCAARRTTKLLEARGRGRTGCVCTMRR